jgi:hypothetical protein
MSTKVPTVIIPLDKTNQIRIRLTTFKNETKVFIQRFWKPGEDSKYTPEADGYCFGKAATIPVEKFPSFIKGFATFAKAFVEAYPETKKKGKKKPANEEEALFD